MNEVLCKIISTLNSTRVRDFLESIGYTYNFCPLDNYNSILRNTVTLEYNIKIFNANEEQIQSLSRYLIRNVFKDDYIRKLISNRICMLSYSYKAPNINSIDYREILNNFLGRAIYTYTINKDAMKIIVDVPFNTNVSLWKPTLKKKEASIILEFLKHGVIITDINFVFSLNKIELDDIENAFLDMGFVCEKPIENKNVNYINTKTIQSNLKELKSTSSHNSLVNLDALFKKNNEILVNIFNRYKNIYCSGLVIIDEDFQGNLYINTEKSSEIENIKIHEFIDIENNFNKKLAKVKLEKNYDGLKDMIDEYSSLLEKLELPPF